MEIMASHGSSVSRQYAGSPPSLDEGAPMVGSSVRIAADLDLDAAARQSFGASFDRPGALADALSDYWSGNLILPPHPVWDGDRLDWVADPFQDRNWQFQHHTLRWINPLRWTALDGDEAARREWLRVARSWFEANVPAESAASPFAWKDMADGNRGIQLALGAGLASSEDAWFVELLGAHRHWLMDEKHIVGKNHGLHQHAGLFVLGAVLRDKEAMATAMARMTAQFTTTFDDQGCNDEGSTAYHQLNLRWWSQAWRRVELEGYRPPGDVVQRLASAGVVLAHLAQPDGRLPQIGDSARGSVVAGLGSATDFVATHGARGTRPEATTLVLDGGYVLSRSGWGEQRPLTEESHMVLRHGHDVRAHSHHDLGSLHIYAAGRPWLVDSGFHSYQTGDPTRKHLHSRHAHNVALLPDRKYDLGSHVKLERAEVSDAVHDFVTIDPGYTGATLHRRVLYLVGPDCWIVWDTADGDTGPSLRQHWHVDTGLTARWHDRGFTMRDKGRSLSLSWLGASPKLQRHSAQESHLRGWIGTRWKTLAPGTLITAETHTPARGLALLIAPSTDQPLGIVESYVTTKGVLAVRLTRGERAWSVRVDSTSGVDITPFP